MTPFNRMTAAVRAFALSVFPPSARSGHALHCDYRTLRSLSAAAERNGHTGLMPYGNPTVRNFIRKLRGGNQADSAGIAARLLNDWFEDEYRERSVIHASQYALCAVPHGKEREHITKVLDRFFRLCRNPKMHDGRDTVRRDEARNAAITVNGGIPDHTVWIVFDDFTGNGSLLSETRRVLIEHNASEVITVALTR